MFQTNLILLIVASGGGWAAGGRKGDSGQSMCKRRVKGTKGGQREDKGWTAQLKGRTAQLKVATMHVTQVVFPQGRCGGGAKV